MLRSGQTSAEYFDKYLFESDPVLLARVVSRMTALVPAGTELLGGLELGGVPLVAVLSQATGIPALFVRKQAKSYGTARLAEGADPAGHNVLLVEDVINTGVTLDYVLGVLRERRPASLEVVTLLDRPSRRIANVHARYTGFQISNDYVVGYGLGYRELYRNLPFICTLKPSVYARDSVAPVLELPVRASREPATSGSPDTP